MNYNFPRRARKIAHKGNFLFFKENFFWRCAIFFARRCIFITFAPEIFIVYIK